MKLDVAKAAGRQLELRRVEVKARHAESDLPVQRVVRAARQDACSRTMLTGRCFDGDAGSIDLHGCHARPSLDDDTSRRCLIEEILIERPAIDDDGFDAIAGIDDLVPGGRPEACRCELVQQRSAGQVELVEGVFRQNARAVHGLADAGVFLEKRCPKSRGSEAGAGEQASGPAADDDHVVHRGHSTPYNLRSRASHRPRNVIQNDSMMSRRSNQNDCRRM